MAKLNVKNRKKVKKAEAVSGTFEPLKPGKYLGDLQEVEVKTSQKGNEYWNATFGNLHTMDGDKVPGKQWYMLMLPADEMPEDYKPSDRALQNADGDVSAAWDSYQEMVAGRIKAFFEAFGVDVDADTDDLLGETAVLTIGIETIQSGAKAGEKTNRVRSVTAWDRDLDELPGDDGDDDF